MSLNKLPHLFISYLFLRHLGRHDQPLVVPVHHDHDPEGAGGQTPRVLVDEPLLLRLRVLEHNIEHLGEVLA